MQVGYKGKGRGEKRQDDKAVFSETHAKAIKSPHHTTPHHYSPLYTHTYLHEP
jgi:hypothetical protein